MDTRTEFARGVEAFQAKNFELARDQFQKVEKETPNDPAVHLNLALTLGELKDPYLAVAHLRAAEEIAGHTSSAKLVAENLKTQNGQDLLAQTENFSFLQTLNDKVLMDVSLWGLSALASVLVLASLWFWILKRIKERVSVFYPALFSVLAVVFVVLLSLKIFVQQERRGTVTEKDAPLFVEADATSPQLLVVPQGQYLTVKDDKAPKDSERWYEVEIDGVGTGYMKADQIFVREKM